MAETVLAKQIGSASGDELHAPPKKDDDPIALEDQVKNSGLIKRKSAINIMWTTRGWRISGWRWKTFAKHLWTKVNTDDVLNRAAIITALALMFYGSRIAEAIANHYGFGAAFTTVWKVLRWVFVVLFVFLAFELIYYFAPDLNIKQLRWLAPGAMTGVVLWLLVSFLFGTYLTFITTAAWSMAHWGRSSF